MGASQGKSCRIAQDLKSVMVVAADTTKEGEVMLLSSNGERFKISGKSLLFEAVGLVEGGISRWRDVVLPALVPFTVECGGLESNILRILITPVLKGISESLEQAYPPTQCDVRNAAFRGFYNLIKKMGVTELPETAFLLNFHGVVGLKMSQRSVESVVVEAPSSSEHVILSVDKHNVGGKLGVSYRDRKITKILRNGVGYASGLREGMIIKYINGHLTADDKMISRAFKASSTSFPVVCEVGQCGLGGGYSSEATSSDPSEACNGTTTPPLILSDVPNVGSIVFLHGTTNSNSNGRLARLTACTATGSFTASPINSQAPPLSVRLTSCTLTHPSTIIPGKREVALFLSRTPSDTTFGFAAAWEGERCFVSEVDEQGLAGSAGFRGGMEIVSVGYGEAPVAERVQKILEESKSASFVLAV